MKKLLGGKALQLHVPEFDQVAITLVGCGGTGSHIASGLVAIGQALEEKGIRIDTLFIDPDTVEERNVGRQLFSLADVGRPKAVVLAERLNLAFGSRVGAAVREVDSLDNFRVEGALNVVVGAVDNVAARKMIYKQVANPEIRMAKIHRNRLWWLDAGNDTWSGQVGIGNCVKPALFRGMVDGLGMTTVLPAPSVVWPDLLRSRRARHPSTGSGGKATLRQAEGASCAELAATGEQGLMVNRMTAAWVCALLYDFLVVRELRWFALAFDLAWGGTRAYTLDAATLAEVTGIEERKLFEAPRKRRRR